MHGMVPVDPPPHLVFHALHTTLFHNLKAVSSASFLAGFLLVQRVPPDRAPLLGWSAFLEQQRLYSRNPGVQTKNLRFGGLEQIYAGICHNYEKGCRRGCNLLATTEFSEESN